MHDVGDFPTFYRAANAGRDPFPWQARLAAEVVDAGWPSEIGVPTGLGKTGCIDIAVWALAAAQARDGSGRRAATRIWYVVNRRLLVDAAWERGKVLASLLREPESLREVWADAGAREVEALATVAAALRSMAAVAWEPLTPEGGGSLAGPLAVLRLRGGADLGLRVPDPSQPALVLATVPAFASRWLFRGYGSSNSLSPVDAALAGMDSLVLLDEAHLSRPLAELAGPGGALAQCDIGDPERVLPENRCRPEVVALTATGKAGSRFELDDADHRNPTVAERLHATKLIRATTVAAKDLPKQLALHAVELLEGRGGPASCVVFANTPRTARAVAEALRPLLHRRGGAEVLLLTGRVRESEAATLRERILGVDGASSGRISARDHDLVVVATQTLEVGADVDFECLVSESAGARAIVQRLGRLNRLGRFNPARGIVCHPEGDKVSPVYGEEAGEVWRHIAAAAGEAEVDLSPETVVTVVGPPGDEPDRVGILLPQHLWELAKTSTRPDGEAPVELFFSGFGEAGSVSVLWRASIPGVGHRLFPRVRASESVDIPLWELRDALEAVELRAVSRLGGDRERLEEASLDDLRPGDDVILPAEAGLYDQLGWNPASTAEVVDISALTAGVLLLAPRLIANLVPGADGALLDLVSRLRSDPDRDSEQAALDPQEEAAQLGELLEALRSVAPHPWISVRAWQEFLGRPLARVVRRPGEEPYIRWAPKPKEGVGVRSDSFEELSFGLTARHLREHLQAVGALARAIAVALGCSPELAEAVALAGKLHDLGKLDPRFQRWLAWDPTGEHHEDGEALAKSGTPRELIEAARVAAGWPRFGRHELLSGRIAERWLAGREVACDPELVVHLVASHHGGGRPFVPVVADRSGGTLAAEFDGDRVEVTGNVSVPDWDQPRRFRAMCERYGYWGLALLEAIVRQADHAASSVREVN
jgi:CRISPR-associated endonuclease/helicase Cas3